MAKSIDLETSRTPSTAVEPNRPAMLREADWLLQTVVENLNDGVVITDLQDEVLYVNSRLAKLVGCSVAEMVGRPAHQFFHEIEGWLEFQGSADQSQPFYGWKEGQLRRKDGRKFWAEVNSTLLCNAVGEASGTLITVKDITERKWLEEYLRLLESVVVNANEIVMISQTEEAIDDPLGLRIVYVNDAFSRATGYSSGEAIGKSALLLLGEKTSISEVDRIRDTLNAHEPVRAEVILYRKDESHFWVDVNMVPIRNEQGQVTHFVSVMREVTERKIVEEQLRRNAFHDSLTGLPNRLLFMERLSQTVERAHEDPNYRFALLFLDLDRFKVINDSLGHMIGDQLLIAIARRLESCLNKHDTVARLGGDEFTILLENIKSDADATKVAERVQKALSTPFNLSGHEVFTSASIGITLSSTDFDRPEDLLRGADIAMYRAKAQGKACHEVFDHDMHTHVVALMQLENDLRRAVERQDFELYYQPIVALATGRIMGFEALVRWQHPEQGIISPAKFVPIAEETGLIIPLGQWVLREACRQLKQWQDEFSSEPPLTVSVNLSSRQFSQPSLINQIRQILVETGIDAHCLKLEITESAIMENTESAMDMLLQLKAMGIQLSVDDFGTGYSSLGYLYRFPMDVLKIDRSFVSRVDVDGEKLELVRTIITLAWNLGMDVVAEGVETTKQLAQLKALKCEYGQGFLFSKPLPRLEAAKLIPQPHPFLHLIQT
ncbi:MULTISPECIES: sensor domain-containing protein [Leptolyngbya]|jgi:diguanylate cyclase (GGDEF)-like protein/PAS domain S-box-containing protein|uniref:Response regulator receiver modulated diguanylate cyclase/phosphodiesterase with PAS/PAC sensor(S) n=1 Tax=Leptolyngbya boryana NIES-2135 TaxID=1973484 RepID=A0A1Z4JHW0_LEPBY|nr:MULTISPECIES: EAL domain-containing protein [Leptolyngbya]BAY56329.1 response regulator receiver modulated diguanylate cyclase/phosphodiesterase with PAS/PAC sensor(s) [Leptolyngbya boryana NIES-2135]MBD1854944.1 EAL domain-containing protein [Leptolyngbya sp. FACHB-1624]MBD2366436.1 EAL domain-containing protein [Leptolyngbya sp. FACHB-161]MBD2372615.1 EAL domain-containing protein [Leptolyngbya sp. FACHB-238]MBD2397038.1 EAL domain-containing protein [Leptolyngbya sp. FACHB-239]